MGEECLGRPHTWPIRHAFSMDRLDEFSHAESCAAEDASRADEKNEWYGTVAKRTSRKVDLNGWVVTVRPCEELPSLRGDTQYWTGWPFFDIKIAHFEMNAWMRASGCLEGHCDFVHHDFEEDVENAEAGLMKLSGWPDSKWESIIEAAERQMQNVSEIV